MEMTKAAIRRIQQYRAEDAHWLTRKDIQSYRKALVSLIDETRKRIANRDWQRQQRQS
jgi:hypothetical protein